ILMARTSPAPFAVTFTFPPPALTSTVLLSSSACVLAICSCIFCACFISLFKFMVLVLRRRGGGALGFRDYLSVEQPDRFLNKRIFFGIFRPRILRSRRLSGRKVFVDGKLHTPVRSGNLMEQCLKKFAIGLRSQDIHHRFVLWCKTKLEIAPFDPKDVGCGSRISYEGLLRGNLDESLLPELIRIGGSFGYARRALVIAAARSRNIFGVGDSGLSRLRWLAPAVSARGYRFSI